MWTMLRKWGWAPPKSARRRPRIVLFGDSLTQRGFDVEHRGWAAAFSHDCTRKADVINRGFSGYNTRWALHLTDKITPLLDTRSGSVDPQHKDCLVIFFGANDASLSTGTSAGQHVPIEEYKQNLRTMVDTVRRSCGSDGPTIVLVSPPPMHEGAWAEYCNEEASNRTWEASEKYAKACEEAAEASGVIHIDLWYAFHIEAEQGANDSSEAYLKNLKTFFTDGLHLSESGNRIVYEALCDTLSSPASLMPLDAPLWDQIDPRDADASFL